TAAEKEDIPARLVPPGAGSRDEILGNATRLLSEITQHAAVIVAPDPSTLRFSHLEFHPLRSGKVMGILVTTDGRIENKLITFDEPLEPRSLERIHGYLNGLLSGLTLDEVRERVLRELGE